MFRPSIVRSALYRKQKLEIQTLQTNIKNVGTELQIALEANAEVAEGLQSLKRMIRVTDSIFIGTIAAGFVFATYKGAKLPNFSIV